MGEGGESAGGISIGDVSCRTSTPLQSPSPPFPVATRHASPQTDANGLIELTDPTEKTLLSRFRPYSAFKDSGVEWLREIPAHWHLKRLKDCVARLESGGTPESYNDRYWTDEGQGIPWVAISDMTRDFHLHTTTKRITEEGRRSKRLRILPAGTLLYSMYASLGKVALLETEAVINQAILGVVPRSRMALRDYLRWWFEFMRAQVQMLSSSNTQDNLSADRVRKMPVALPPEIKEQQAIAAFLDRETAKIEALVAKKERLVELLLEKRTALITRAVTRGLDPSVPMKHSGVEWLGEIPAHWKVRRLKDQGALIGGAGFPHDYQGLNDQVLPFYKVGDLSASSDGRYMRSAPNTVSLGIAKELRAQVIPPNSIIYAKIGAALLLNRRRVTTVPCCIDNNVSAYVPGRELTTEWALHWTTTVDFAAFAHSGAVPSLSEGDQADIPIVVPPLAEQHAIAIILDEETARINRLIARVREATDYLKEYRTALISAAVTGKIDVRKEAA